MSSVFGLIHLTLIKSPLIVSNQW